MCCYDYDCVICVVMIARILQIYAEGEKNASLPAIITYYHIYYRITALSHYHIITLPITHYHGTHYHGTIIIYSRTGTCSIEAESLFFELSDFGL